MKRRVAARRRLAVLGAAVVLAAGPASAVLHLDYLAIRANEGGSAGGHAAVRFGAETFHFEHVEGLLRLGREDSRRFQHVYRTLQNRDIELSRIPVSRETYRLLRDAFRRRTLVQERQVAIAAEYERDAELLESLLGDDPGLDVRGAGFFQASGAATDADAAPSELIALRERIEALQGPDFLARRAVEVERTLAALEPGGAAAGDSALSADRYPDVPVSFSRRVEDALAARLALELLARPVPLAPQALARGWQTLPLTAAEIDRLRQASADLREQTARLASSRREDFGYPLLLGMARLAALETSLRTQRLALLDAYPTQSPTIEFRAPRRAHLADLLAESRADLDRARERLHTSKGWREADWNALEAAASRWLELRAAEAGAASIRVQIGALVPEARARVSLASLLRPVGSISAALDQTRAAGGRHQERLADLYRYDLVRRNCVSEIFRTLEAALAQDRAGADAEELRAFVREESGRRLGGYVDPIASLNFVPFVSSQRVRSHWNVRERVLLPSYRRHRLAEMSASEPRLLVGLRESNVMTARSHWPAEGEGFFLFFTDGAAPARPLLGAINLGAGLLRSAVAVRGAALRPGARAALGAHGRPLQPARAPVPEHPKGLQRIRAAGREAAARVRKGPCRSSRSPRARTTSTSGRDLTRGFRS